MNTSGFPFACVNLKRAPKALKVVSHGLQKQEQTMTASVLKGRCASLLSVNSEFNMPAKMFLCALVAWKFSKSVCSTPQVSCPMIEVTKKFE